MHTLSHNTRFIFNFASTVKMCKNHCLVGRAQALAPKTDLDLNAMTAPTIT